MTGSPSTWATEALGDLTSKLVDGSHNPPAKVERGVPMLSARNIHDGKIEFSEFRFIAESDFNREHARTLIQPDDVLLTIVGAIGRAAVVPATCQPFALQRSVAVIGANPAVDPEFLRFYLQAPDQQKWMNDRAKGTAQRGIYLNTLSKLPVLVPPIAEQRRIVAKLGALTARTASASAELERVPALAARYRQAVLAAAFRGDLTTDVRVGTELSGLNESEQEWPIPQTWRWRRIQEVGEVRLGRQRSPINHSGPHMRPYLRAANITWGGLNLADVNEMNFDEADFAQFKLMDGDVLVNEGSGSAHEVGKPAIWRGEINDCCFQNTLLNVRPTECSSEYLCYYILFSARSRRLVEETQGVNIFHIGKAGLSAFPVPVAPPAEQAEIVERLRRALAEIDRLADEASAARLLLERLDQAILAKAFRGELVPQDPADEPAAVLLERIHAERAGKPVQGRRRKAVAAASESHNAK